MILVLNLFLSLCFAYEYGIDQIQTPELSQKLLNKNIAILGHAASVDKHGNHLIDLLYPEFQLKKIFAPEHGLRTGDDDYIQDGIDQKTGLPIVSLYKQDSRAPKAADLKGIDLVIIDLQDVGVRYYTYFSTVAEFIKVTASLKIPVMILDRPNPIGGAVEGEKLTADLTGHFISYHNIPTRHGLTLGELALLYNSEKNVGAKVEVVKVLDWKRENLLHTFDRPWTPSSPALTTLEQVMLYAQVGSLESFNLSIGRGVDNSNAFKVLAAPWISLEDSKKLAAKMNELNFTSVEFFSYCYRVDRALYNGQNVCGVKIQTSPRFELNASDEMTYKMAKVLYHSFPKKLEFNNMAHRYYGSMNFIDAIKSNIPWTKFKLSLRAEGDDFLVRRSSYLIY